MGVSGSGGGRAAGGGGRAGTGVSGTSATDESIEEVETEEYWLSSLGKQVAGSSRWPSAIAKAKEAAKAAKVVIMHSSIVSPRLCSRGDTMVQRSVSYGNESDGYEVVYSTKGLVSREYLLEAEMWLFSCFRCVTCFSRIRGRKSKIFRSILSFVRKRPACW